MESKDQEDVALVEVETETTKDPKPKSSLLEDSAPSDNSFAEFRARKRRIISLEKYLWLFVAIALWLFWVTANYFPDYYLSLQVPFFSQLSPGWIFLIALAATFFPIIHYQTFETLPFEASRGRAFDKRLATRYGRASEDEAAAKSVAASQSSATAEYDGKSSDELFAMGVVASHKIAEGIYRRAGVYLMIGVFIAFGGVVFFYIDGPYFAPVDLHASPVDIVFSAARTAISRIGVLIFIEIVAFYFLKLYRAAMDEYRYFEAIKRRREEMLIVEKIRLASGGIPADILDLVKSQVFFSGAGILGKEQTSEIIEARKLEKGELELLDKVVAVIDASRKK